MREAGLPARHGIGIGDRHRIVETHELAHARRQPHRARHAEEHVVEPLGPEQLRLHEGHQHGAVDQPHHAEIGRVEIAPHERLAPLGRQRLGEQHAPDRIRTLVRPASRSSWWLGVKVRRNSSTRPKLAEKRAGSARLSQLRAIQCSTPEATEVESGTLGATRGRSCRPVGISRPAASTPGQAREHVEDEARILRDADIAVGGMREIDQHARVRVERIGQGSDPDAGRAVPYRLRRRHCKWRLLPPCGDRASPAGSAAMRRLAPPRCTGFGARCPPMRGGAGSPRGAAMLAPRPDWPPPAGARLGVAVGGELGRASGLGEGARLMLAGLAELGVPCWRLRGGAAGPGRAGLAATGEMPPAGRAAGAPRQRAGAARRAAAPAARAAARPPRDRLLGLGAAGRAGGLARGRALRARGLGAVALHRRGARAAAAGPGARGAASAWPSAPPRPAPLGRADFGLPAEALVVLASFSLASSFERKNPLGAIAALRAAFGGRPDRILVLKVGHPGHFPARFRPLAQAAAGAANIRLETRTLPAADSHALTACRRYRAVAAPERGLRPGAGRGDAAGRAGGRDRLVRQHANSWMRRAPAWCPTGWSRPAIRAACSRRPARYGPKPTSDAAAADLRRLADDPALRRTHRRRAGSSRRGSVSAPRRSPPPSPAIGLAGMRILVWQWGTARRRPALRRGAGREPRRRCPAPRRCFRCPPRRKSSAAPIRRAASCRSPPTTSMRGLLRRAAAAPVLVAQPRPPAPRASRPTSPSAPCPRRSTSS